MPNKYAIRSGRALSNDNFYSANVGTYSAGFGYNVRGSGFASFSAGYGSQALSSYSTSIGYFTYASGFGSVAMGHSSRATGSGSFAVGLAESDYSYPAVETQATSEGSSALGVGVIASGAHSFSAGFLNVSSGSSSTSIGYSNLSSGYSSLATGAYNLASQSYSGAFGLMSESNAYASFVLGRGLESNSQDSTVVGRYNDPIITTANSDASDRPLFIVGNGTNSSNPSNAFVVRANGVLEGDGSGLTGLAGGQLYSYGGNVGVGVSNPNAKLHVSGTSTFTQPMLLGGTTIPTPDPDSALRIPARGTAGEHRNYIELQGVHAANTANENGGAFIKFRTSTSPGYGPEIGGARRSGGAGDFLIKTGGYNPQERLRVMDNGRVGIGTSNPLARLHVELSGYPQLVLGENPTNSWQFWGGNNLHIRNSAGEDAIKINADKSVVFSGAIQISQPQGDIPMGDFN